MRRKLLTVAVLIVAVILLGRLFLFYWLLGLLSSRFVSSKLPGEQGRFKSVFVPIIRWRLHLHHWLYSLCLLGLSWTLDIHFLSPVITYGLLGGFVFQGIYYYNDWYVVISGRSKTYKTQVILSKKEEEDQDDSQRFDVVQHRTR